MHGEIHQGEYGQNEEEKCSSADQNPEQSVRASFSHGASLAPSVPRAFLKYCGQDYAMVLIGF
jgi:hypothetical protein